ncbi:MAG TPA: hypothetical protein VGL15_08805 [Vicinamibacteria bacterium]
MRVAAIAVLALSAGAAPAEPMRCGTDRIDAPSLLALHQYATRAGLVRAATTGAADVDQAGVAVLQDRGDLVIRRNPFDLDGSSVRLSPNRTGGFDAARVAVALEPPGGTLALGADEARAVDLPFPFRFYSGVYREAFVHADGSVTFDRPDVQPAERSLARFVSGPPRVAAFFADLDPARGGTVSYRALADRAVVSWTGVAGAAQINHNTFQLTLHAGGEIDLVYGEMQSREAIAGASPGAVLDLTPADLSEGRPSASAGALAERFSETEKVDLVGVTRRFYAEHADAYDQLVVYTTRPLNPLAGSLAFELNVRNDVRGIGLDVNDQARQWGASRLSSVVFMDTIDAYLDVDGFEILGHEVGHRWLARAFFRDLAGRTSDGLLGRGGIHWSFFFDTSASVLEGNDIAELGGGRFETVDFTRGYSALDQYLMGLRDAREVPPFFYVEGADDFRPNRTYKVSSSPEAGVSFTGRRRDVRIEDVIAAMGPREPDAAHASRVIRQAYVLVADEKAPATAPRVGAVARIRTRFEAYYVEATGGRGTADTAVP